MTDATLPDGRPIAELSSGYLTWWVSRAYLRIAHPDTLQAVLDELANRFRQHGTAAEAESLVEEARAAYVAGAARRAETVKRKREAHARRLAEAEARRAREREARRAEQVRLREQVRREIAPRGLPNITFRER
jgi:hypothetical protein